MKTKRSFQTFIMLLFLLLFSLRSLAQSEVLTNQSIIDMVNFGFEEEVILSKIESSSCSFDTSIESLKKLKEAGLSGNVIAAMVRSAKAVADEASSREGAISGIFYTDFEGELRKIYPTAFSGNKSNVLGAALTYGLANVTMKATMPGSTSANIVGSATPVFYFFFNKENGTPPLSDWWFSAATSPHQFVLMKLEVKRNSRRLKTGRANLFTGNSSTGIDEESSHSFHIRVINEYEFEVRPLGLLEPGEYCFIYKGVVPGGGYSNQAVFDFSIPQNAKRISRFKPGDVVYARTEKGKIKDYTIKRVLIEEDGNYIYECETFSSTKLRKLKDDECAADKKNL